jgi:hypothetical protein
MERMWSVLFATLSVARSVAPDERADASAHTLMALLEPGPDAHGTVFFVARRRGQAPAEGIVLTMAGSAADGHPVAHLRMHREVSDVGPRMIEGWLDAGFREARPITLRLRRAEGGWSGELAFDEKSEPLTAETAGLLASAASRVWADFMGASYDERDEHQRPESPPAGLEAGRRDIDEVLSDTRLTPRL